eukprot:scpid19375/ scgid0442/ Protein spire homolog 1
MKDTCVAKAEQAACGRPSAAGKPSMRPDGDASGNCQDGRSLEALLPKLKSISEEQAWAICFLTSLSLVESNPPVDFELSMTNVHATSCGSIVIKKESDKERNSGSAPNTGSGSDGESGGDSEDEETGPMNEEDVVTSLGMLIYNALDYGLNEDAERELTAEMQELIEKLTTEPDDDSGGNGECTSDAIFSGEDDDSPFVWPASPVTTRQLIKVCEFRVNTKDQPAVTHYQDTCRKMVQEADVLALYRDADGEYIMGLDFLEEAPPALVRCWRDVIQEILKKEINLRPTQQVKSYAALQASMLDQLRRGSLVTSLRHVEPVPRTPRKNILRDIRQGLKLKPAAERILSEKVKSRTEMETLMDEISETKTRAGLRTVPDQDKRYRDRPAPDSTTVLYRALRRAEMERQQDYGATSVDNDRAHLRAPGHHRTRSCGISKRKQAPNRRHLRIALENNHAHARSSSFTSSLSSPRLLPDHIDGGDTPPIRSGSFVDFKGFSPQGVKKPALNLPGSTSSGTASSGDTLIPIAAASNLTTVPSPSCPLLTSEAQELINAKLEPLAQPAGAPPDDASSQGEQQSAGPDQLALLSDTAQQQQPLPLLSPKNSPDLDEQLGGNAMKSFTSESAPISKRQSITGVQLTELETNGDDSVFQSRQQLWRPRRSEVGLNSLHHSPRPALRRRVSSGSTACPRLPSRELTSRRPSSLRRSARLQSTSSHSLEKPNVESVTKAQAQDLSLSETLAQSADFQPLPLLATGDSTPALQGARSHGKQLVASSRLLTLDQPLPLGHYRHQFLHLPSAAEMGGGVAQDQLSVASTESDHRLSVLDEPDCRKGDELSADEMPTPTSRSRTRTTSTSQSSAMPLLMTGGLSYKEIVNIRTKQTDAEIEAQDDTGTKIKLRNGKVCFVCKKKRFTFFSLIGARTCILCGRKVCQECTTKMVLLDVDFTDSIVSDLEALSPIEACFGCRISLLDIQTSYRAPDEWSVCD